MATYVFIVSVSGDDVGDIASRLSDYVTEAAEIGAEFDGADFHVTDPIQVTP